MPVRPTAHPSARVTPSSEVEDAVVGTSEMTMFVMAGVTLVLTTCDEDGPFDLCRNPKSADGHAKYRIHARH